MILIFNKFINFIIAVFTFEYGILMFSFAIIICIIILYAIFYFLDEFEFTSLVMACGCCTLMYALPIALGILIVVFVLKSC